MGSVCGSGSSRAAALLAMAATALVISACGPALSSAAQAGTAQAGTARARAQAKADCAAVGRAAGALDGARQLRRILVTRFTRAPGSGIPGVSAAMQGLKSALGGKSATQINRALTAVEATCVRFGLWQVYHGGLPATATPAGGASAGSAVLATVYRSPLRAALSWFYALNHQDQGAAVAHFEPAAADMMGWSGGPRAWPAFSALHCKTLAKSAASATVYCAFHESQAPAVGNPDTFWQISLHRRPDGRWLIGNYGQG